LVHEHDHEVHFGVVDRDGVRDLLEHDRLPGLGRCDDEPALALADRRDQVDDALGQLLGCGLQAQALLRIQRRELAELDAAGGILGGQAVDRVHLDERVVLLTAGLLPFAGLLDGADDRIALAQVVLLHLAERHVDVAGAGEVSARAHERVVVEDVEDAGDRDEDVVLADLGLELVCRAALATALAPAPASAAAGRLLFAVRVRLGRAVALPVLPVLVLAAAAVAAAAAAAATGGLLLGVAGLL